MANGDDNGETNMAEDQSIDERVRKVEIAQATQAATLAGAEATQAAAMGGMMAAVGAGAASLIVGIFLGIAIGKSK